MMEHVWLIITILIFHEEGRFHLTYMMMVIVFSDLQENDHYLTHKRTIIVLCHLQEDDHYFISLAGGRTLSFVTHRRTEHGATNLVALSTKLGRAARWALVHNKNLKKGKKSTTFSFSMKR